MKPSATGRLRGIVGVVVIVTAVVAGGYFMGGGRWLDAPPDVDLVAELTTAELVVGRNRVVVGLTIGGAMDVVDADVDIEWTSPTGKVTTTRATYIGKAFEERGAYSAMADLPESGEWKMLVRAAIRSEQDGRSAEVKNATYDLSVPVYAKGSTPAIGAAVPRSETPVASSTGDALSMCSARPACSMHDHSVAASIAAHRPFLVFFAVPGQCASRLCGPMLSIVEAAKRRHSSAVDFIHVEVTRPGTHGPVPTVKEWKLISEPWVFVVDSKGRLVGKFEGPTTPQEIEGALRRASS